MPQVSERQELIAALVHLLLVINISSLLNEGNILNLSLRLLSPPELEAFLSHYANIQVLNISDNVSLLLSLLQTHHPLKPLLHLLGLSQEDFMVIDHVLQLNDCPIQTILRQLLSHIERNRYLGPRNLVARAPQRITWLLYEIDDVRFKQEIRMGRYESVKQHFPY